MSATQKEIAEVFRRRVEEVGYAKATLDDVARAMKISKKTIYVHFDSKRDIYAHIVERQAAARRCAWRRCSPRSRHMRREWRRPCGSCSRRRASTWSRRTATNGWQSTRSPPTRSARPAATSSASWCRRAWTPGSSRRGDARLVEQMLAAMIVEYLLLVREDPSYDRDEELLARIRRFIG